MTVFDVEAQPRSPSLVHTGLRSRLARQSITYATASLASSLAGGAATVALARHLDADHYAVYSFAKSVLMFSTLFFEFGLVVPVARAVARAHPNERARVVGAGTAVVAALAIGFSAAIFGFSFIVDGFFTVKAGSTLRAVSIVAAGWAMAEPTYLIAQGAARVGVYAVFSVLSRTLCLVAFLALILIGHASATTALAAESILLLGAWTATLARLRPSFTRARGIIRRFGREAREYGLAIYIGRVLSTGTYTMDVLMLGALAPGPEVAYYTLAGAFAGLVALLPNALCAALFNRMTGAAALRRTWFWGAFTTSCGGAVTVAVAAAPFVHVVLGRRYAQVVPLALVLAAAAAVGGVTRLFNAFLTAQGRGSDLRFAAIALTVSNLVLNLTLIPTFGALGAAWASLLALVVNFAVHVVRYRAYLRGRPGDAGTRDDAPRGSVAASTGGAGSGETRCVG